MEQDFKIGSVGDAKVSESLQEESASVGISVLGGAVVLDVGAKVENAGLVALLASRLPGGFLHDGLLMVAKDLGVVVPAPAAPAAAPSA